jgi:hypothetical protein
MRSSRVLRTGQEVQPYPWCGCSTREDENGLKNFVQFGLSCAQLLRIRAGAVSVCSTDTHRSIHLWHCFDPSNVDREAMPNYVLCAYSLSQHDIPECGCSRLTLCMVS